MNTPTSEQRQRFERLCMLRALYARRGPRDTSNVMTVDAAIRYGQALLRRYESRLPSDAGETSGSAI